MESEEIQIYTKTLVQTLMGNVTDMSIENVEVNNDGFTNNIALFNLSYSKVSESFSEEVVLKRFFNHEGYTKELGVLKSNEVKACVNLPAVYFEDREQKTVLMEKVEGVTLDCFISSQPGEKVEALHKFGETLAHIHSIKRNAILPYLSNNAFGQEAIESHIHRLKNRVEKFNEPLYIDILDRLSDRCKSIETNEVFNHGDYHFKNIIRTEESKWILLDWEKARIADYRYDLANTLVLGYSWFGIEFKKELLKGYFNITQKQIKDLDFFESLISFDSYTKALPLIEGGDDSYIRDRSFNWLSRRYELFVKYNGTRIKKAEDFLRSKGITQ